MIPRLLSSKLKSLASKMPVVALVGPRQSGKTTLLREVFPEKPYVSLEDLETRRFAKEDPNRFLQQFPKGAVLDEIQRTPEIFSYLQGIADTKKRNGLFILSGSQNFLMMENLSQTLAGRVNILKLLPLCLEELKHTAFIDSSIDEFIFQGFYPRLYDQKIRPQDWYPSYISAYLERDLRDLKSVHDLAAFHKFLRLCAGRCTQLLNLSSLASDCGITHNTAKSWISLLETSFIVYLLEPHHQNFNKRLVKTPKLFFYDTGLVSSLLGIENEKQVSTHPLRGALFENMIMSEILKFRLNQGLPSNLYFWRDQTEHEMDCLVEKGHTLIPIEIKSGSTISTDWVDSLTYWKKISKSKTASYVIYGGEKNQLRSDASILSWKQLHPLFETLSA